MKSILLGIHLLLIIIYTQCAEDISWSNDSGKLEHHLIVFSSLDINNSIPIYYNIKGMDITERKVYGNAYVVRDRFPCIIPFQASTVGGCDSIEPHFSNLVYPEFTKKSVIRKVTDDCSTVIYSVFSDNFISRHILLSTKHTNISINAINNTYVPFIHVDATSSNGKYIALSAQFYDANLYGNYIFSLESRDCIPIDLGETVYDAKITYISDDGKHLIGHAQQLDNRDIKHEPRCAFRWELVGDKYDVDSVFQQPFTSMDDVKIKPVSVTNNREKILFNYDLYLDKTLDHRRCQGSYILHKNNPTNLVCTSMPSMKHIVAMCATNDGKYVFGVMGEECIHASSKVRCNSVIEKDKLVSFIADTEKTNANNEIEVYALKDVFLAPVIHHNNDFVIHELVPLSGKIDKELPLSYKRLFKGIRDARKLAIMDKLVFRDVKQCDIDSTGNVWISGCALQDGKNYPYMICLEKVLLDTFF